MTDTTLTLDYHCCLPAGGRVLVLSIRRRNSPLTSAFPTPLSSLTPCRPECRLRCRVVSDAVSSVVSDAVSSLVPCRPECLSSVVSAPIALLTSFRNSSAYDSFNSSNATISEQNCPFYSAQRSNSICHVTLLDVVDLHNNEHHVTNLRR